VPDIFGERICVTVPNFVPISQTIAEISRFLDFSEWWPLPSRIFLNFNFVMVRTIKRVELHHCAKFRQNHWNRGRDMAIFPIFKMAAAAILDFWNCKFLTVGCVVSVELHHLAKFCDDQSYRCPDIVMLGFFKMAAPATLDFCGFKFLTAAMVKKIELRHCAKFCRNRSNRGGDMSVFDFLRWWPPCWTFEILNF